MEQWLPNSPFFACTHCTIKIQTVHSKKQETGVYANRFRKDFNVDEKQKG